MFGATPSPASPPSGQAESAGVIQLAPAQSAGAVQLVQAQSAAAIQQTPVPQMVPVQVVYCMTVPARMDGSAHSAGASPLMLNPGTGPSQVVLTPGPGLDPTSNVSGSGKVHGQSYEEWRATRTRGERRGHGRRFESLQSRFYSVSIIPQTLRHSQDACLHISQQRRALASSAQGVWGTAKRWRTAQSA